MSVRHLARGDANPPVKPNVLRIYSMRYCPYAQRALLVLNAKGIPHEIVNCNLAEKPEFLVAMNATGKVPVLQYLGNVVCESLPVSELIDEIFPEKPLSSTDPFRRAQDKAIVQKFDSVASLLHGSFLKPDDEKIQYKFRKSLVQFEKLLLERETPFFNGNQCGMVDLMVWPWFERMLLNESSLDPVPDLRAWIDRMKAVPAVKACAEPKEHLLQFQLSLFARRPVYDIPAASL